MKKDAAGGVFINGKAQIVEMLQYMNPEEKEVLLKNIRVRNSQLADELGQKSVQFEDLFRLSDHEINTVLQYVNASIVGIALKRTSQKYQRRLLSIAPREYAEKAYQTMMARLNNEKRDVGRAQAKVLSVLGSLIKRRQITL
ncbi:MAG: hypothetical protein HN509_09455 [Halobacteriovoraceae bacterium]|jgi:flagellar motor switch protein FliG|nr:hypothetical protein [Halobacteriovoraceae bacterium]MBT5095390.1 hypothetical protein [Halobacteriovoraceae bacterium]